MKKLIGLALILIIVGFLFPVITQEKNNAKIGFLNLSDPCLGQKPPGLKAQIFAPGIISTQYNERSLVFSPDGKELFFEKWGWPWVSVIVHGKVKNNGKLNTEIASFSGIPDFGDGSPFLSFDGKTLFFNSQRPRKKGEKEQKYSDIWISKNNKGIWQTPVNLGKNVNSDKSDGFMSVAKNGNLYFESNRDGIKGQNDVWFCKWENDHYLKAQRMPEPVSSKYWDGHPCISPDENFIVFTSNRPGDLGNLDIWVSFKKKNGAWTTPKNLGAQVNTKRHEAAPTLSPDGKYLFWMSERSGKWPYEKRKYNMKEFNRIYNLPQKGGNNIYWISTQIIENLRPEDI